MSGEEPFIDKDIARICELPENISRGDLISILKLEKHATTNSILKALLYRRIDIKYRMQVINMSKDIMFLVDKWFKERGIIFKIREFTGEFEGYKYKDYVLDISHIDNTTIKYLYGTKIFSFFDIDMKPSGDFISMDLKFKTNNLRRK